MRREVYIDCRVLVFFFECSTRGINKTYTRLFYTTTLSLIHCNLTPAAASFFFFFKNCSFSISLFFVNSTVVSNHETGQSCDFCTTRQRRKISGEKKEAERKSERRNAGVSATPLGRQSNESKGKTVTRADAALLYHLLSISRNTNHHHHHTRRNTERVFLHFNSKPKYIMTYTGNTKDTTFIFFSFLGMKNSSWFHLFTRRWTPDDICMALPLLRESICVWWCRQRE